MILKPEYLCLTINTILFIENLEIHNILKLVNLIQHVTIYWWTFKPPSFELSLQVIVFQSNFETLIFQKINNKQENEYFYELNYFPPVINSCLMKMNLCRKSENSHPYTSSYQQNFKNETN